MWRFPFGSRIVGADTEDNEQNKTNDNDPDDENCQPDRVHAGRIHWRIILGTDDSLIELIAVTLVEERLNS